MGGVEQYYIVVVLGDDDDERSPSTSATIDGTSSHSGNVVRTAKATPANSGRDGLRR